MNTEHFVILKELEDNAQTLASVRDCVIHAEWARQKFGPLAAELMLISVKDAKPIAGAFKLLRKVYENAVAVIQLDLPTPDLDECVYTLEFGSLQEQADLACTELTPFSVLLQLETHLDPEIAKSARVMSYLNWRTQVARHLLAGWQSGQFEIAHLKQVAETAHSLADTETTTEGKAQAWISAAAQHGLVDLEAHLSVSLDVACAFRDRLPASFHSR